MLNEMTFSKIGLWSNLLG